MKPVNNTTGQTSFQPNFQLKPITSSSSESGKVILKYFQKLLIFFFAHIISISFLTAQSNPEVLSDDFFPNQQIQSLRSTLEHQYKMDLIKKINSFNLQNSIPENDDILKLDSFVYFFNFKPSFTHYRMRKCTFNYENKKLITATKYFIQELLGLKEEPEKQTHYQYSENDLLIDKTNLVFSKKIKNWEPDSRITFNYDENSGLTEITEYKIFDENGQMTPFTKTSIDYVDPDRIQSIVIDIFDPLSEKWLPSKMMENDYDDQKKLLEEMFYEWDDSSESWLLLYLHQLNYDVSELLLSSIYSKNDNMSVNWIPEVKYEYLYDNYGNLSIDKSFDWNPDKLNWEAGTMIMYIFDGPDELAYEIIYKYDKELSEYYGSSRKDYTYDKSITFLEMVLPYSFLSRYFHHKVVNTFESIGGKNPGKWRNMYKGYYHYSPIQITQIRAPQDIQLKFFPNPVQNRLTLILPDQFISGTFELFDLSGKKVLARSIQNNESFDISFLKAGSYFFQLINQNRMYTGKLIKK